MNNKFSLISLIGLSILSLIIVVVIYLKLIQPTIEANDNWDDFDEEIEYINLDDFRYNTKEIFVDVNKKNINFELLVSKLDTIEHSYLVQGLFEYTFEEPAKSVSFLISLFDKNQHLIDTFYIKGFHMNFEPIKKGDFIPLNATIKNLGAVSELISYAHFKVDNINLYDGFINFSPSDTTPIEIISNTDQTLNISITAFKRNYEFIDVLTHSNPVSLWDSSLVLHYTGSRRIDYFQYQIEWTLDNGDIKLSDNRIWGQFDIANNDNIFPLNIMNPDGSFRSQAQIMSDIEEHQAPDDNSIDWLPNTSIVVQLKPSKHELSPTDIIKKTKVLIIHCTFS